MPAFRKDPIVDCWVSVATERSQRPSDFPLQSKTQRLDVCPLLLRPSVSRGPLPVGKGAKIESRHVSATL